MAMSTTFFFCCQLFFGLLRGYFALQLCVFTHRTSKKKSLYHNVSTLQNNFFHTPGNLLYQRNEGHMFTTLSPESTLILPGTAGLSAKLLFHNSTDSSQRLRQLIGHSAAGLGHI